MVATALPGLIVLAVFGGMFTGAAPKAVCYTASPGGMAIIANIVGAFLENDAEEPDNAQQHEEQGQLPTKTGTLNLSDTSDTSDTSDLFDAQPESAISIGRIGRIGRIDSLS